MDANLWGCSSVGRAPALQAGGQEFESLHLHCRRTYLSLMAQMYLENCIPNEKLYKYFIIRHPRILIERLIFLNNKNKFLNIVYDTR